MRSQLIAMKLMELALGLSSTHFSTPKEWSEENQGYYPIVKIGTRNKYGVAQMSGRGEFMKLDFDNPELNKGVDVYLPARIGKRYVRLSALGIGVENCALTYSVSVRNEGDISSVESLHIGSCFGAAYDEFIKAIEKELLC